MRLSVFGKTLMTAGLLLSLGAGCNPSFYYFILPENKSDPELKRLASKDKEVRVVILTYSNKLETRPELLGAERELAQVFAKTLREYCERNSENVVIVNPRKVEEFKSAHPSWAEADLSEVGRHFKADYVIYLEVNRLALYDQVNFNQQYNGQVDISVSLIDVNHPENGPEKKEFVKSYPSEAKAIPVDSSTPPALFRQAFMAHIAKHLAWYFTEHLPREGYNLE